MIYLIYTYIHDISSDMTSNIYILFNGPFHIYIVHNRHIVNNLFTIYICVARCVSGVLNKTYMYTELHNGHIVR